jgi:hypothetical protein
MDTGVVLRKGLRISLLTISGEEPYLGSLVLETKAAGSEANVVLDGEYSANFLGNPCGCETHFPASYREHSAAMFI